MITIKIGGSVVDDLHPSTISDIKKVAETEGIIIVHGGGKEVTKVCEQLGKEPNKNQIAKHLNISVNEVNRRLNQMKYFYYAAKVC